LPWENSMRWHCTQELPPSVTQMCDADTDVTAEMCVMSFGTMQASWCINPNPTATLVCGGVDCGLPAASNTCRQIPLGGRGNIANVCPE
jgi:hypothetical protein